MTETDLTHEIQLAATAIGARLFRNNVGALKDERGEWVRYGLVVGSSDLIGWVTERDTAVVPAQPKAIFVAIEVKIGRRKATPEQMAFIHAVRQAGGRAGVARSVEEALAIIRGDG